MNLLLAIILISKLLFSLNTQDIIIISMKYYDNNAIKSQTGTVDKKKVYDKLFYKNGKLKANVVYPTKEQKFHLLETFDIGGNLVEKAHMRNDTKPNSLYTVRYKNGIKIAESTKIKIDDEWQLDGVSRVFNDKGVQIREVYYQNGKYLNSAYCSFDTSKYETLFLTKHIKDIQDFEGGDIYCKRLVNSNLNVMVMTFGYGEEIKLILGVIDTNTSSLNYSFFDNGPGLDIAGAVSIENLTYQAITDPNVFDVVSSLETYRGESFMTYSSYKVAIDRIVALQKPTFKLKNIEQDIQNGKALTFELLSAILFEEKIADKTVDTYINILHHFQKNNSHKEVLLLATKILDVFTNRTPLYLTLGDSSWELKKGNIAIPAYEEYVSLMKQNNEKNKGHDNLSMFKTMLKYCYESKKQVCNPFPHFGEEI